MITNIHHTKKKQMVSYEDFVEKIHFPMKNHLSISQRKKFHQIFLRLSKTFPTNSDKKKFWQNTNKYFFFGNFWQISSVIKFRQNIHRKFYKLFKKYFKNIIFKPINYFLKTKITIINKKFILSHFIYKYVKN